MSTGRLEADYDVEQLCGTAELWNGDSGIAIL